MHLWLLVEYKKTNDKKQLAIYIKLDKIKMVYE